MSTKRIADAEAAFAEAKVAKRSESATAPPEVGPATVASTEPVKRIEIEHNPDPRVRTIETSTEAGEWTLTVDGPIRKEG